VALYHVNVAIWEMNGHLGVERKSTLSSGTCRLNLSLAGTWRFQRALATAWAPSCGPHVRQRGIVEIPDTTVFHQNSSFVAKLPGQWSI